MVLAGGLVVGRLLGGLLRRHGRGGAGAALHGQRDLVAGGGQLGRVALHSQGLGKMLQVAAGAVAAHGVGAGVLAPTRLHGVTLGAVPLLEGGELLGQWRGLAQVQRVQEKAVSRRVAAVLTDILCPVAQAKELAGAVYGRGLPVLLVPIRCAVVAPANKGGVHLLDLLAARPIRVANIYARAVGEAIRYYAELHAGEGYFQGLADELRGPGHGVAAARNIALLAVKEGGPARLAFLGPALGPLPGLGQQVDDTLLSVGLRPGGKVLGGLALPAVENRVGKLAGLVPNIAYGYRIGYAFHLDLPGIFGKKLAYLVEGLDGTFHS